MRFTIKTKGHYHFIDITDKVRKVVEDSGVKEGIVLVFIRGSTAALTIMEFEEGLIEDIKEALEKIAPEKGDYKHHLKWSDRNGAAHIKSALVGTDLVVPIESGELGLGNWQQVVLIDFDEKEREREVVVKCLVQEHEPKAKCDW